MKSLRIIYLSLFHPGMGWFSRRQWRPLWLTLFLLPTVALTGCLPNQIKAMGYLGEKWKDNTNSLHIHYADGVRAIDIYRNYFPLQPAGLALSSPVVIQPGTKFQVER